VIHEAFNPLCQPLDRAATQEVRAKYQLPDSFILFVGGLNPLKNFSNLLYAYHRLQADISHQLVVVGFNRWKFAHDLELVDKLGLHDRVRFIGFIPDEEIPAFYTLADVFAFPSLYEGFGIPILEAMACGCPVVTSKTGCGPEVAGEAASLVDPYSPSDIAKAISALLTDGVLRQRLRELGLKRAGQFSWPKCAQQTLALFQSL
jgi:glycosyltransferase involved in cell wall biosynthesis